MKRLFPQAPTLVVLAVALALATARGEQAPSADEILRTAREKMRGAEGVLKAQLLNYETGEKSPFRIIANGEMVRYVFDDTKQELRLKIGDDSARLTEGVGDRQRDVPAAELGKALRGTDVTYEDLAMRFLYWPNARLRGEDNLRTRDCWKVEIQAPRGKSQYPAFLVWIDQATGALMKMQGYGADGRILKSFEVVSVQKLDGQWTLKNMRVETYDPKTHKQVSMTRLMVLDNET